MVFCYSHDKINQTLSSCVLDVTSAPSGGIYSIVSFISSSSPSTSNNNLFEENWEISLWRADNSNNNVLLCKQIFTISSTTKVSDVSQRVVNVLWNHTGSRIGLIFPNYIKLFKVEYFLSEIATKSYNKDNFANDRNIDTSGYHSISIFDILDYNEPDHILSYATPVVLLKPLTTKTNKALIVNIPEPFALSSNDSTNTDATSPLTITNANTSSLSVGCCIVDHGKFIQVGSVYGNIFKYTWEGELVMKISLSDVNRRELIAPPCQSQTYVSAVSSQSNNVNNNDNHSRSQNSNQTSDCTITMIAVTVTNYDCLHQDFSDSTSTTTTASTSTTSSPSSATTMDSKMSSSSSPSIKILKYIPKLRLTISLYNDGSIVLSSSVTATATTNTTVMASSHLHPIVFVKKSQYADLLYPNRDARGDLFYSLVLNTPEIQQYYKEQALDDEFDDTMASSNNNNTMNHSSSDSNINDKYKRRLKPRQQPQQQHESPSQMSTSTAISAHMTNNHNASQPVNSSSSSNNNNNNNNTSQTSSSSSSSSSYMYSNYLSFSEDVWMYNPQSDVHAHAHGNNNLSSSFFISPMEIISKIFDVKVIENANILNHNHAYIHHHTSSPCSSLNMNNKNACTSDTKNQPNTHMNTESSLSSSSSIGEALLVCLVLTRHFPPDMSTATTTNNDDTSISPSDLSRGQTYSIAVYHLTSLTTSTTCLKCVSICPIHDQLHTTASHSARYANTTVTATNTATVTNNSSTAAVRDSFTSRSGRSSSLGTHPPMTSSSSDQLLSFCDITYEMLYLNNTSDLSLLLLADRTLSCRTFPDLSNMLFIIHLDQCVIPRALPAVTSPPASARSEAQLNIKYNFTIIQGCLVIVETVSSSSSMSSPFITTNSNTMTMETNESYKNNQVTTTTSATSAYKSTLFVLDLVTRLHSTLGSESQAQSHGGVFFCHTGVSTSASATSGSTAAAAGTGSKAMSLLVYDLSPKFSGHHTGHGVTHTNKTSSTSTTTHDHTACNESDMDMLLSLSATLDDHLGYYSMHLSPTPGSVSPRSPVSLSHTQPFSPTAGSARSHTLSTGTGNGHVTNTSSYNNNSYNMVDLLHLLKIKETVGHFHQIQLPYSLYKAIHNNKANHHRYNSLVHTGVLLAGMNELPSITLSPGLLVAQSPEILINTATNSSINTNSMSNTKPKSSTFSLGTSSHEMPQTSPKYRSYTQQHFPSDSINNENSSSSSHINPAAHNSKNSSEVLRAKYLAVALERSHHSVTSSMARSTTTANNNTSSRNLHGTYQQYSSQPQSPVIASKQAAEGYPLNVWLHNRLFNRWRETYLDLGDAKYSHTYGSVQVLLDLPTVSYCDFQTTATATPTAVITSISSSVENGSLGGSGGGQQSSSNQSSSRSQDKDKLPSALGLTTYANLSSYSGLLQALISLSW